jgi:hypothetical protein
MKAHVIVGAITLFTAGGAFAADLRTHAGHMVTLTGELKGDTILVSKIEMPATSK